MIQYSLVCPDCKRKGVAAQCAHRMDLLPPWKSEGRQKLVKFLLGNSEDMFLTEAMGEIASSKSRCFAEELVDSFLLHPMVSFPIMHKSRTVFVCIDPTSGVRSELAIASAFFTTDNCLCVSFCFYTMDDACQHASLVACHVSAPVKGIDNFLGDKFVELRFVGALDLGKLWRENGHA